MIGKLARIGPKNLLTSDPEIFRQVLGIRSAYERGTWFDCLRILPHRANLITERNRTIHNSMRKQMAAGVRIFPLEQLRATDTLKVRRQRRR